MRKTFRVEQYVSVEVDEAKFTPEFMEEFRRSFYPFQTVTDHMEFLAWNYVVGNFGPLSSFIEGYGPPADFGIVFREESIVSAEEEEF
jgi:hypothetical protein